MYKAHDANELSNIVKEVRGNNRTPLIVSTSENPIAYQDLMAVVDPDSQEFNLR